MSAMAFNQILDNVIVRIRSVVEPRQIVLFGSAARGEMHENSDIDLLVVVPNGLHRRKTAQNIYRNLLGFPGLRRIPSEARGVAAWAVNELSDATLVNLAERLRRDPSTMSAAVKRFNERMKADTGVAEKVEQLKAGLQVSFFQV